MEIVSGIIVCLVALWFVLESSNMVDEKKQRQRKGLTDYYDNPIKKENDETVS